MPRPLFNASRDSDSLACMNADCIRYHDHPGTHEYSWGDSIPWPPEADLDLGEQAHA